MVYTGDPLGDPVDEVRFMIGDTDNDDLDITDLEIDYLIQTHTSATMAAIQACYMLAAKFSRLVDTQVDDVRVRSQQKQHNYFNLGKQLARREGLRGAIPDAPKADIQR